MSKNKTKPAPATVLVITLEPDGNGSLLTRRGDLAHLSQFTYRGLKEIVAAIQAGAAQLVELEENPPIIASEPLSPPTPPEVQPGAEIPSASHEDTAAGDESSDAVPQADVEAIPVAEPNSSVFALKIPQPKLF
ncbi:MAG: hypothetical protein ACYDBJ_20800 [Aggregatilineales bacterium]